MNRPNDMARVRRLIADFRAAMPDIALRTTFIVGFPGETDAEFAALLDFLQEIAVRPRRHVHLLARRGHARRATLPDPVPEQIKQRRYRQAMQLQQGICARKNRRLGGPAPGRAARGRPARWRTGAGAVAHLRRAHRPPGPRSGRHGLRPRPPRPRRRPGRPRAHQQATEYDLWGKQPFHSTAPAPSSRPAALDVTERARRPASTLRQARARYAMLGARRDPGFAGAPGPLVRLAKKPHVATRPGRPAASHSLPFSAWLLPGPAPP